MTFTGGVSEYIFGREADTFGDLASPLAEYIQRASSSRRIDVPVMDPGQGIRAPVIGASRFSVRLSGKTIHLSDKARLPVRNVPVVFPAHALGRDFHAAGVAAAIAAALPRIDLPQPARYLASAFGSLRYPFTEAKRRALMGSRDGDQQAAAARSVKLGGDPIELEDQSPRIHAL